MDFSNPVSRCVTSTGVAGELRNFSGASEPDDAVTVVKVRSAVNGAEDGCRSSGRAAGVMASARRRWGDGGMLDDTPRHATTRDDIRGRRGVDGREVAPRTTRLQHLVRSSPSPVQKTRLSPLRAATR